MPKIVYQADASQLKKENASAAQSVAAVASSAEQARKRIIESYEMQIAAAKELGASHRELEAITRRTADMLANTTDNSAARQIKSLDRLEDKIKRVAAARKLLGGSIQEQDDHYRVSAQVQASASIRAMSGTPSLRAAEFWAASTPLGGLFERAFPIVGAGAFAMELARGVQELVKLNKEAKEVPDNLRNAFEGLNAPLILSVDTLRKTNDELEISIAKLEHKPANALALGIDEARIHADQLAESINRAAESLKKLLEENKVGFKEWLITGQGMTGPFSAEINKRMKELRDLQRENRNALRSGKDTPEKASSRDANITSKLTGLYDFARKNRQDLQSFDNGTQTANINILQGVEDYASNTLDEQAEQKRNATLVARQKQLELQQNLRRQSAEEQRKGVEETKRMWDDQYSEFNGTGDRTKQQERQFWYDRINIAIQGSELYTYALRKANDLLKQMNMENHKTLEERRRVADEWNKSDLTAVRSDLMPGAVAQSRGIMEGYTTGVSLRDARRSADYSAREASIAADEQAGRITRLDAAVQLQTLHTKLYNDQLIELKENLEAVQGDSPDAAAQKNRIKQQITDLDSRRQQEVLRDRAATGSVDSYGSTGARDALDQFVIASRDAAGQMRSLVMGTIGSLNNSIASAAVGGRGNFAEAFRSIGQNLFGNVLTKVEGSILGRFGFGKADGSKGNPFYVIVDPSGTAAAIGGIGKSSGVGWLSTLTSFLPGRAMGGPFDAGQAIVVGERGPEVMVSGSSGRIVPNNALGGGDTHLYSIDARGAHDPAAVEAAVQRGLDRARPGIVAQSVAANKEYSKRRPSTAR